MIKPSKIFLTALTFVSIFLFFPTANSFAQNATAVVEEEKCDCWCGKTGEGARTLESLTFNDCAESCEDYGSGWRFVACVKDPSGSPYKNLKCWTQEECEKTIIQGIDVGKPRGVWGDKTPYECPEGEPEKRYCYPPPAEIPLNINLGGITEVKDIGGYVNALYRYALGAGALAAIIMLMIGGVQYMVGGAIDKVSAAKERIKNALIGLVLLLGTYTILATINPQLLSLAIPKMPKIKPITLITEQTTCEELFNSGFTLKIQGQERKKSGSSDRLRDTACDTRAEVVSGPDGGEVSIEECRFSYCAVSGEKCVSRGENSECIACSEVGLNNPFNLVPSDSLCASLEPPMTGGNKTMCIFTKRCELIPTGFNPIACAEGVISSSIGGTFGTCAQSEELLCNTMRTDGCGAYSWDDDFTGSSYNDEGEIETDEAGIGALPNEFEKYCESDPCNIATSASGSKHYYKGEEIANNECVFLLDTSPYSCKDKCEIDGTCSSQ